MIQSELHTCRARRPAKMVLTLASVWGNTSAVLAILATDRRTMLTVDALVAFAALVHQPGLLNVDILGDPADVHLGASAAETWWFEAPTGRLVLVGLVCSHLGGHCVPGERHVKSEALDMITKLTFPVSHTRCLRPSHWKHCCQTV